MVKVSSQDLVTLIQALILNKLRFNKHKLLTQAVLSDSPPLQSWLN